MALSGQLDPEETSLAILALRRCSRTLRLPCPQCFTEANICSWFYVSAGVLGMMMFLVEAHFMSDSCQHF